MRVVIIGSGLAGITTAYYLSRAGHEVLVLDKSQGPAMETSYANGGMITPSQADPWNAPGIIRKIFGWTGRKNTPLKIDPLALLHSLGWGLSFLRNSTSARFRRNIEKNIALANYSLTLFQQIRTETEIKYDSLQAGTMKIYRDPVAFDKTIKLSALFKTLGIELELLDVAQVVQKEPTLADAKEKLVGGVYFPNDESGDAYKFCLALSHLAEDLGARFRYGVEIKGFKRAGEEIQSLSTTDGNITADTFVLAAGCYSALLGKQLRWSLPVRPIKGYSLTFPQNDCKMIPAFPIVDDSRHFCITPMTNKFRIAGMAEIAGYNTEIDKNRVFQLQQSAAEIYPDLGKLFTEAEPQIWTGLRPYCCDGVPVIGPTPYKNLYVNTGQGHLGWSMSLGSARLLTDIIDGRSPHLDGGDYRYDRF